MNVLMRRSCHRLIRTECWSSSTPASTAKRCLQNFSRCNLLVDAVDLVLYQMSQSLSSGSQLYGLGISGQDVETDGDNGMQEVTTVTKEQ